MLVIKAKPATHETRTLLLDKKVFARECQAIINVLKHKASPLSVGSGSGDDVILSL